MSSLTPKHMHGAIFNGSAEELDAPRCVSQFNVNARAYGTGIKAHEYEETTRTLRIKVKMLAQLVCASDATIAFTGAGISTMSGIHDYASKSNTITAVGRPLVKDWKLARPTLTHYALTCMHRRGLLHHWINQNHDSLPQKAKFPQHALNEIHGSLHDIANSIVPFEGTLRDDLYEWMEAWKQKAKLCLALGTSMSGFNCDSVAETIGERYIDEVDISTRNRGLVICNLQETQYDHLAKLRIFAKTDDVFEMLAEELGFKSELETTREEIYSLPDWIVSNKVETKPDVFYVPFDPDTALPDENKTVKWDLRIGARLKLTGGPYAGDEGVVVAKSAEGHWRVQFSNSIHPVFNVRRRKFSLWLGSWWIEMAMLGHGIVPGGKLPFINCGCEEENSQYNDSERKQHRVVGRKHDVTASTTKWMHNGDKWVRVSVGS